jgi:hypothetical protein
MRRTPVTPLAPNLYTSYYANAALITESGCSAARISIGNPRWKLPYAVSGGCKLLMPTRDMLSMDREQYQQIYFGMLEAAGVEAISEALHELWLPLRGPGLVLLCFEALKKPDEWCHRRMFADWWQKQTGDAVPELGVPQRVGKYASRYGVGRKS